MEDPLDGHPQIAGGWIGVVHGEVEHGVVDGAGDPAAGTSLHGIPLRIIRSRGRAEPSMCERRANLPHSDLKKNAHLE
jgi:hypothetical protein